MRRLLGFGLLLATSVCRPEAQEYTIAFASMAPLDSDIFVAHSGGADAKPFLPHPALDYNASLSDDGQWVVFTSERHGSPDIYRARIDGSELSRLTDHDAFDDQATLSADGRWLAFVSTRSGSADVWTLDLQTRQLRNVTQHAGGDFRPAWSPDGEWLAFSSDRDLAPVRVAFHEGHVTEVYVVRRDGSELRRLTHDRAVAGSPSWSRDGKRVVYYVAARSEIGPLASRAASAGTTQLVELEISTGRTSTLTSGPGAKVFPKWRADTIAYLDRRDGGSLKGSNGRTLALGAFHSPDWSADGGRFVFDREVRSDWPPLQRAHSRDAKFGLLRTGFFPAFMPDGAKLTVNSSPLGLGRNAILIANADGTASSTLFEHPTHSALAPVWSPRGDRVAFGLGRFFSMVQGFAPSQVAILTPATRELTMLTAGAYNAGFPSWSPDGKRLAYRLWSADTSSLHIADIETRAHTVLLENFGRTNFPAWSPDGRTIMFTADRSGDYELYTINVETKRIARLTDSPGTDAHGSWSPDGAWIAFSSVRGGYKDEAALNAGHPQAAGDIYVMRADGSDVRALTDNAFEEGSPNWAPIKQRTTASHRSERMSPSGRTIAAKNARPPAPGKLGDRMSIIFPPGS